jgi:hypothetical protein
MGHLHQLQPGDGANDFSGFIDYPVVSGEVAGVMIGDGRNPFILLESELPVGQQLLQNHGVVTGTKRRSRVFILHGIETMGRKGHNIGDAVFVKGVEGVLSLLHKQARFAHPLGYVTAAGLFLAKNAEFDTG